MQRFNESKPDGTGPQGRLQRAHEHEYRIGLLLADAGKDFQHSRTVLVEIPPDMEHQRRLCRQPETPAQVGAGLRRSRRHRLENGVVDDAHALFGNIHISPQVTLCGVRDANDVIDPGESRQDTIHKPASGASGAPAGQFAITRQVGDQIVHGHDRAAMPDQRQIDGVTRIGHMDDVGVSSGQLKRRDQEPVEIVDQLAGSALNTLGQHIAKQRSATEFQYLMLR